MARAKKESTQDATAEANGSGTPRARVSQSDVPRHRIQDALRIPKALADEYGKQPTRPLGVARALGMQPTSSNFRTLTGASIAYGLTEGGYNAEQIALTDLGRQAVAPTVEGGAASAVREAFLRPRVIREFLEKYDGSRLPSDEIAQNVLEEMGVPAAATERVLQLIVDGASDLGFFTEINGRRHVDLQETPASAVEEDLLYEEDDVPLADESVSLSHVASKAETPAPAVDMPNRKVFISHGSNKKVVQQVKDLLLYGDFEPIVSVERETTSKPVPDKVLEDMRACSAGIIHVGAERTIVDEDGKPHPILNQNVLIEIGAAMALYDGRFILLVEKGTVLPSNLQGLYEVRFEGEGLDSDATLRLLKAFKDFKS